MTADVRTVMVLVATCDNLQEPDGDPCPGFLAYRKGQQEAACDTCGARCGIAVANWMEVAWVVEGNCPAAFTTAWGYRRCDLPDGHHGVHIRYDGFGRPEYYWMGLDTA